MPTVYQSVEGNEREMYYFVEGLTRTNAGAKEEALSLGGIPQEGDPHPYRSGLKAEKPEIVQMWEFAAKVRVGFVDGPEQQPAGGTSPTEYNISIVTSTIDVDTLLDAQGNPIKVKWAKASTDANKVLGANDVGGSVTPGTTPGVEVAKGASVTMKAITTALTFSRETSKHYFSDQIEFVGRTNDAKFATLETGAWLCTHFSHSSSDRGKTWRESIEFTMIEQGWDQIAAFIREDTNEPPALNGPLKQFKADRIPRIQMLDQNAQAVQNGFTIVRVQGTAHYQDLALPDIATLGARGRR